MMATLNARWRVRHAPGTLIQNRSACFAKAYANGATRPGHSAVSQPAIRTGVPGSAGWLRVRGHHDRGHRGHAAPAGFTWSPIARIEWALYGRPRRVCGLDPAGHTG